MGKNCSWWRGFWLELALELKEEILAMYYPLKTLMISCFLSYLSNHISITVKETMKHIPNKSGIPNNLSICMLNTNKEGEFNLSMLNCKPQTQRAGKPHTQAIQIRKNTLKQSHNESASNMHSIHKVSKRN